MTREEVIESYQIPEGILQRYEKAHPKTCLYDEEALEELGLLANLVSFGCSWEEAWQYLSLKEKAQLRECASLLAKKRKCLVEEIHHRDKMLSQLDCMRYALERECE